MVVLAESPLFTEHHSTRQLVRRGKVESDDEAGPCNTETSWDYRPPEADKKVTGMYFEITHEAVKIREDPWVSSVTVGRRRKGEIVEITHFDPTHSFGRIVMHSRAGYMGGWIRLEHPLLGPLVQVFRGELPEPMPEPLEPEAFSALDAIEDKGAATVCAIPDKELNLYEVLDGVNIRDTNSPYGNKISVRLKGQIVHVRYREGNWGNIRMKGGLGIKDGWAIIDEPVLGKLMSPWRPEEGRTLSSALAEKKLEGLWEWDVDDEP